MNVLYLTNNAGRASTTVPTRGWFEQLCRRGLRPVIASPVTGEFSDWADSVFGSSIYRLELPVPSKFNPLPFITAILRLRTIVKRHGIQLIHCNEQDVYPVGGAVARFCGLPAVVSCHFTMARGYCEWAFGGRRCPNRLIFTSIGNLEACRAGVTGVIPEERWRVLPNGINLDYYRPDDTRRQAFRSKFGLGNSCAIGIACALRPRKQLEHLFEVARQTANLDVKVVVAGGPIEEDANYARELLIQGQHLLGERLLTLGDLNDLRDFYNGLDVYVNTSQEEACSLSVCEALSSGCPVLGYPSKSVDSQVLPHGGEIVPQDDVRALAASLRVWLDNRSELFNRRASARRQAEELFDARKRSAELWDIYTSVLAERCRPASRVAALC